MAKMKCYSIITHLKGTKNEQEFINSDGKHDLSHYKASLIIYNRKLDDSVQYSSEISTVDGKDAVELKLDGRVILEGFHTPNFTSNAIYGGTLSYIYDILFTYDLSGSDVMDTCVLPVVLLPKSNSRKEKVLGYTILKDVSWKPKGYRRDFFLSTHCTTSKWKW